MLIGVITAVAITVTTAGIALATETGTETGTEIGTETTTAAAVGAVVTAGAVMEVVEVVVVVVETATAGGDAQSRHNPLRRQFRCISIVRYWAR